ncbi:MAG TPA: class I SAM-dependent methyltransferase [Elusimicrobiota bacterium]|nr:class I SAM-dependent methyltransferase [Elusimicrobiota bacterium]
MTMESAIGRVAREQLEDGIVSLFVKQALAEAALTWRRRVRFRRQENAEAVRAYCAMTPAEFEGINARQRWANWRTIPRSLHGRLPAAPCKAVDLCSGVGHSAQVLAYYLPRGSEILGLEYNPEFVRAAEARSYEGAGGEGVKVRFRTQSVLETFRDAAGEPLADASVDLVNACGALGIHFVEADLERLLDEVARVLKPGGLAAVDSGSEGVDHARMIRMFEKRGFETMGRAKSCFLDRFTHLCFRKPPLK